MDERIYNERTMFTMLKLLGVGFLVIIGYINLDAYFTNKEYPTLTRNDSLDDERISLFKNNRGAAFVEFASGRKYRMGSGVNLNYEDNSSIVEVLSFGGTISKRADSDTITIRRADKDYQFLLGQVTE